MAWWKTGEGDNVMGDWPADIVGATLSRQFGRGGRAKDPQTRSAPTCAALLRTWQDALNSEPRALLADATAAAYRLVADVDAEASGARPSAIIAAEEPSPLGLRNESLDALRAVARAYRDAVGRAPRLSELSRCLTFSLLGPAHDGALADGPLELSGIRIEPMESGRH